MLKRLLPREVGFYDYFEQHCALVNEACKKLQQICADGSDRTLLITQIKELEHKADDLAHRCIEDLHKTFITPIDRHDIHRLISCMDDIIDCIEAATARMDLYKVKEIRPAVREQASVLVRATEVIAEALQDLRKKSSIKAVTDKCIHLHQLENEGDGILRTSLAHLFETNQPIMVIKWKEIYELLERAIDHCEDVANIIEGVMIEAS